MSTTSDDDPLSLEDTIGEFYHAVEMYEGNLRDLRIVQAGLNDPTYSEQEQRTWREKLSIKAAHLQRSVDRLLLMTNSLRVLAQRVHLPCPTLDGVARSLIYKPYHDLPPNPPTEQQLEKAQDEAELVGAALGIVPPATDDADAAVDERELAVQFNTNHRRILKELLRLRATEPAAKKTQKEIVPAPDDYNNFKREFSELRRKGYLLPPFEDRTTRGRWLSAKGVSAAEWLRTKRDLD